MVWLELEGTAISISGTKKEQSIKTVQVENIYWALCCEKETHQCTKARRGVSGVGLTLYSLELANRPHQRSVLASDNPVRSTRSDTRSGCPSGVHISPLSLTLSGAIWLVTANRMWVKLTFVSQAKVVKEEVSLPNHFPHSPYSQLPAGCWSGNC